MLAWRQAEVPGKEADRNGRSIRSMAGKTFDPTLLTAARDTLQRYKIIVLEGTLAWSTWEACTSLWQRCSC